MYICKEVQKHSQNSILSQFGVQGNNSIIFMLKGEMVYAKRLNFAR